MRFLNYDLNQVYADTYGKEKTPQFSLDIHEGVFVFDGILYKGANHVVEWRDQVFAARSLGDHLLNNISLPDTRLITAVFVGCHQNKTLPEVTMFKNYLNDILKNDSYMTSTVITETKPRKGYVQHHSLNHKQQTKFEDEGEVYPAVLGTDFGVALAAYKWMLGVTMITIPPEDALIVLGKSGLNRVGIGTWGAGLDVGFRRSE